MNSQSCNKAEDGPSSIDKFVVNDIKEVSEARQA